MPEIWSFFAGAGGLDIGLEQAGLTPTLAVEIDDACCATLRQNRPSLVVVPESVCDLSGERLRRLRKAKGEVLLMIGGPPCQSFSPGGKRAALNDPRGNLIYEYMRLIADVSPRFFVLENVANLLTAALRHRPIHQRPGKHWSLKTYDRQTFSREDGVEPLAPDEQSGSAIRQILADFAALKYRVRFAVLDAADFGAAQHRLRFVMFGAKRGEAPGLPIPTHGKRPLLQPFSTVRDAIYDLMADPGDHSEYTPEVRSFFDLIPAGGNWRSLPAELQEKALGGAFAAGGGKTGFYRRLSWDAPSPTITGRSNRKGSAICHPEATRPLSVRECARLQGFPDEWAIVGSMSQRYLQVGNAVPVQLGNAIGRAVQLARPQAGRGRVTSSADVATMLESAILRLRASARNKRSQTVQTSLFENELA